MSAARLLALLGKGQAGAACAARHLVANSKSLPPLTLPDPSPLPRRSFTTIIGPNGSGKSNVMDSISFVLGVRTAQLRGNLKELLYHNSEGQSAEDR